MGRSEELIAVKILPVVYKNLFNFVKHKKQGQDVFDLINPTKLNEYLSSLMPGLTAKVFRTFNASNTLQQKLKSAVDSLKTKSNVNCGASLGCELKVD